MNRDYLEKHLSAFLDGELSDTETRQFEAELEKYPDLKARLEQYRRVDGKVRESDVEMPPEGYFENLAMRIDARIEQTSPASSGSFLQRLLHPTPRVLAWAGSMAAVLLIAVVGYETYKPAVQEYSKPVRQSHEMVAPAAVDQSMRAPDTAKMQKVTPSESQVADQVQEEEKTEAAKPQVVKEAEPKPSEKIVGQEVVNTSQERKGKAEDKYKGSSTALSIPKEESSQTAVQQVAVSEPEKSAKIKAEVAPRAAMPVAQFNEVLKIDLDSLALSVKGGRVNELAYDVVQVAKAPEDSLGGQLAGGIVHSEAEFDSLINEYTLRATAQGDSLATETAYQRAVQYKTPDYIDVARRMLEKQLEKVEGDKLRDHYAKMLESLSDL